MRCIRISEILGEPQASLERLLRENIAPEGSKKTVEAISAEKVQKAGNTYYDTSSSVSGSLFLSIVVLCSLRDATGNRRYPKEFVGRQFATGSLECMQELRNTNGRPHSPRALRCEATSPAFKL